MDMMNHFSSTILACRMRNPTFPSMWPAGLRFGYGSSPDCDGLKESSTCFKKLSKLYSCLQPFPAPLFISASHQLMWETAGGSSINMCESGERRSRKPFLHFKVGKKNTTRWTSFDVILSRGLIREADQEFWNSTPVAQLGLALVI